MKPIYGFPLRSLLPTIVLTVFSLLLLAASGYERIQKEAETEQSAMEQVRQTMWDLARNIEHAYADGHVHRVEQEVTRRGLITEFNYLAVADSTSRILYATRMEWKTRSVDIINSALAEQVQQAIRNGVPQIRFDDSRRHIRGYIPVSIAMGGRGLRPQRTGVLLFEYDLGQAKDALWHQIITDSAAIWASGIVAMAILILALHFLVSRPLHRLTEAVRHMEQGELSTRLDLRGQGRLVLLGRAFNDMAARIQDMLETLRQRERDYRTLVDNLPQRVFFKNTNLDYVSGNQSFATDLGIHRDDFFGKTDFDFFPRDLATKYRADDQRVMQQGQIEELEESYLQEGVSRWVRTVKAPVRNEDGQLAGVLGIFWDITDQREADLKRRQAETRLRMARDITGLGVWELNIGTGQAYWDENTYRIIGVDPSREAGPRALMERIDPIDRPHVRERLRAALTGENDYEAEYRLVTEHGAPQWVHSCAQLEFDEKGKPVRMIGVVRDITQRRQTEESLRLAATAFDTHEGILITDSDGNILRVNRAFTEITGYPAEEVAGCNPRILQSGRQDKAFYLNMWNALKIHGRWEGELWNRRKNGEHYPQWETITAVPDKSGKVSHYVAVFFDLTELKSQHAQIERTAAEEQTLGELLRLSLEPLSIETFLDEALQLLLHSVPWLKLLPKGGVFLSEDEGEQEVLQLVVNHDMEPGLSMACRRVPFGHCLCGRAAKHGEIQFCASMEKDERHEIRVADMRPHGHYCVPLKSGETVLGVLTLYLADGHKTSALEEAFLNRVSDVLSAGVIRRRAEAEIEHQAFHDALTGLPNRRLLIERLRHDMAVNTRRGTHGAVLFIDLDNFKKVNDALGHPVGDALLQQVATRLVYEVRTEDTVVRLGGDEFVLLLPQLAASEEQAGYEARVVAEKLRVAISQPCYIQGREHQITPSIGIVLFPSNGDSPEDVLRFADNAMYRAKDAGRNAIRFFMPGMQHAADRRLKMENDLRYAIERNELQLYLQPQLDQKGQVLGAEGLLRWKHSKQGMIMPGDFIPLAEESGLILPLGEWVLEEACRILKGWEENTDCRKLGYMAVNVSPRQFHQSDFIERVEHILQQSGTDPQRIELELTEGVLLNNIEETVDKMRALRSIGVRFSIDDFGTGYSSLAYLKRLPLSKLKIDRSFVQDLEHDRNDATIVSTIISMAKNLKLEVIAEGVESAEQFHQLNSMDCDAHQGFYFAKPMAIDQFTEYCHSKEAGNSSAGEHP